MKLGILIAILGLSVSAFAQVDVSKCSMSVRVDGTKGSKVKTAKAVKKSDEQGTVLLFKKTLGYEGQLHLRKDGSVTGVIANIQNGTDTDSGVMASLDRENPRIGTRTMNNATMEVNTVEISCDGNSDIAVGG